MNLMLNIPRYFITKYNLRNEIADYLVNRSDKKWMLHFVLQAQGLNDTDAKQCIDYYNLYSSDASANETAVAGPSQAYSRPHPTASAVASPNAVAAPSAVTAPTAGTDEESEHEQVAAETFNAMRWASKLDADSNVLVLMRFLLTQIVE